MNNSGSRPMRRLALAAALSAVLLAGCTASPSLESQLLEAVEASEGLLQLSQLDAVDGSAFLVVCPYESADSITDRLGFEWADAPDYSQRDDRQAIAIIRDDTVVSSAELARDDVDFCSTDTWDVLPVDTELLVDASADPVRVSARN